ncbi:hypothetical protein GOBAR_AA07769 [Gossypium barbadense]|uniref:DELLA protein n=1 Tax=Gossypium barbadense TaxID=3634 RepID=A0A2P5YBE9_GOSBA|nr:hypothetical protein GOBAR_AA07769 [Gossypium barbadense]
MKRDHQEISGSGSNPAESSSIKGKLWEEDPDAGGMDDELLAVLGYKVRSSDMADVAQKLEMLEKVMGTAQEDGISQLGDTVHFNPSDLSGWVQNLLIEFNGSTTTPDPNFNDDSEYDLRAIPGVAAYPPVKSDPGLENTRKRAKTESSSSSSSTTTRPVVLIDSQETGVRLVHTLMACAEAVQQDNLKLADALVKHIGLLASSQTGAMRKVATYFAEALARRIYRIFPPDSLDPSYNDKLQMHFYETCPYLKFAHFTANQAILEAFSMANRVHVIDFGLKQGMQWPALMQALALRPGGPPAFRLTGIGPPQPDDTDALQQVGWKLAELAERIGIEFEFRGFVANSSGVAPPSQDLAMSELYLGRQICNVVACEGMDRVERHEPLTQWRTRMETAGFSPVHLGSNAYKQASMLLALFASGDGYRVEENNGCLMLGWHTRPLIATSAWRLAGTESGSELTQELS